VIVYVDAEEDDDDTEFGKFSVEMTTTPSLVNVLLTVALAILDVSDVAARS
jgi:hypothetical protein